MKNQFVAITIGDNHLSDRTPASRTDNYTDTLFEELAMARQVAFEEKADAVLITGDIFDIKSPIKTSHSLMGRAIRCYGSFPCPVYSIVGNHDITNNLMESLPKQPLNVLFESGALKRLTRECINGVDVVGIDFNEENSYESLSPKKDGGKPLIAVVHALATPDGGDYFGETIFSYKKLAESSEVDIYVFGHLHNDQGVKKVKKTHFINLGALSRGSLTDEEINRQVKVGKIVFDGEKFSCSEIPLPVKPAEEIFNIEKKQELQKKEQEIEKFVATLSKSDLFQDITSLEKTIQSMELESGVRNRLLTYLNNRGANINL